MIPPRSTKFLDQDLLTRVIQGDVEAFGDLYEHYLDEIQRYVFYRVADRYEAEELTETVFLKAWEALPRFESSKLNLRAWLYRVAHNVTIDHYRTHKVTEELSDENFHISNPSIEDQLQTRDEQHHLAKAIRSLEDRLQQVIICRFVNGMSHAETAQVIGIKEGHVRVLQLRALQKLRQQLEQKR